MRRSIISVFASLLVCLFAFTAGAAPQPHLVVKDDSLMLIKNGKSIPLPDDMGTLMPVDNSDLRFVALDAEDLKARKLSILPGVYLVETDGAIRFLDLKNSPDWKLGNTPVTSEALGFACDAVSLSPNGAVLAVNFAPVSNGFWFFFTWPDLRPLPHGQAVYFVGQEARPLLWSGDWKVALDVMTPDSLGRVCSYDPCAPVSVTIFDIRTGKSHAVLPGTAQCDYRLSSVESSTVTAWKICPPNSEGWMDFSADESDQLVTAPLP